MECPPHCPPTFRPKVEKSGGALFKKGQKWGGTQKSAPPLPPPKYTPVYMLLLKRFQKEGNITWWPQVGEVPVAGFSRFLKSN